MSNILIIVGLAILIYIGLFPLCHWCNLRDSEYLLKREVYRQWLYDNYYMETEQDYKDLMNNKIAFIGYLKDNNLPMDSELHE